MVLANPTYAFSLLPGSLPDSERHTHTHTHTPTPTPTHNTHT